MSFTFFKKILKRNVPRWIVLFIDTYISINGFIVAYFIRSNMSAQFDFSKLLLQIPFIAIFSIISFWFVGLHRGVIRHSGNKDLENILKSSLLIFAFLFVAFSVLNRFGFEEYFLVSFSILTIHFLINVLLLALSRNIFKYLYGQIVGDQKTDSLKKIMIYGAGNSGVLTSSIFQDETKSDSKVVGFIDDNLKKSGNKINGITIYHSLKIDEDFLKKKNIEELIISIQKISSAKITEITERFSKLGITVKIIPPIRNWMNGELKAQQIKKVNIEDLLGRETINFDNPILKQEFKNKKIVITGAAGSIGSEIAKQISHYDYQQLILLDIAESPLYNLQQNFVRKQSKNIEAIVCDVRNQKRMELLFSRYCPDIVFHASAYKHVPFMEENPYEAIQINVNGTKLIADLAVKYKAQKFVMISTDKAVNPTNVMGASKRIAELYVSALKDNGCTKFITTRFGNVLGSNGSVIPIFENQIKEGGPLTVTHKEITRFFMTIPEACRLVLEAGAMGQGGEIFVFDMGKSVRIFDLALNMIHLSGLRYPEDIDIKIIGLRPGEKIYEELLSDEENTLPTYHDRIKIAKVRELSKSQVKKDIAQLCEINQEMDAVAIVKKMKDILPEFISNNSQFSTLDKLI